MAVEICLAIDDQGKMTVEVEQNVTPQTDTDDKNAQKVPVKSLDDALSAIQQVAQGVLKGVAPDGSEAGEDESAPGESSTDTPDAEAQEDQAMQSGFSGKKMGM